MVQAVRHTDSDMIPDKLDFVLLEHVGGKLIGIMKCNIIGGASMCRRWRSFRGLDCVQYLVACAFISHLLALH